MRDLLVIIPTDPEATWTLDFDFIDGVPRLVPAERNTQDQRAAISAYMIKGTVPGMTKLGIDWSQLYTQQSTLLNIDNSVKQNIQQYAGIPGSATQGYIPVYDSKDGKINMYIIQTQ